MRGVRSDRGVLLRRTAYGESSLVVQVLTPRFGRVHLLAKGAYRPTSRYFAVLDLFDTLELQWSVRGGADLGLLREASISVRRRHLTDDLGAYGGALSALELAEIAARPGQPDPALFQLVEDALYGLEQGTRTGEWSATLVSVVFELRFLQNLGITPALADCAACGGPAPTVRGDRVAFSAGAGGRLCQAHAAEARASGRRVGTLPAAVLEAAQTLASSSPRSPRPTDLPQELIERVRDFAGRFLDYHLETRPKSHRRFLAAPNRNAPEAGAPPAFRAAR